MFAVYGTLLFCGGLVFFFVMLHFHRRPGVAHWLATRWVGEVTVFTSMMISLMGIALVGRFFIQYGKQVFGMAEGLEVAAILIASYVVIRKSYLPPPAEDGPTPAVGIETGKPRPAAGASSRRKAA